MHNLKRLAIACTLGVAMAVAPVATGVNAAFATTDNDDDHHEETCDGISLLGLCLLDD